jgi:hypothetical protein
VSQSTHAAIIRFSVSYYAHASTHSRYKKAGADPGKIACGLQLVSLVASLVQGHALDGKDRRRVVSINEALCLD